MDKLHPSKSFLGQHYKRWRQSEDAKNFAGNELNCYAAYNDVSDETREEFRRWEAAGFPEEEDDVPRKAPKDR